MIQVDFFIIPHRDDPPVTSFAYYLGVMNRVPAVDEYVHLEEGGPEYRVIEVAFQFVGLNKQEVTKEQLEAIKAMSDEEKSQEVVMEYPVPQQKAQVTLRLVRDVDELAENLHRRSQIDAFMDQAREELDADREKSS